MSPRLLRYFLPHPEARTTARPLLSVLSGLTWTQWAQFFIGWLAWTCDAIDFFSVSLSVTNLTHEFDKPTHDITTAITLTLLLRTVGALIMGVISDRFGRKWPMVFNLLLIALMELGAGFVTTFPQFLAVRSLFGIGMGGMWGLSSSTALENLPVEARGLAAGIMQQGYAAGYILAAVINMQLVPKVKAGWRALFWSASGISFFAAIVRLVVPESELFLRARARDADEEREARENGRFTRKSSWEKTKIFMKETREMVKLHWILLIYASLLMVGESFLAHGSQDLYPTYLQQSKNFDASSSNTATIIGNCGAIAGGLFAGWSSQYIGRRLAIITCLFICGAFIPLWILPSSFGALSAGAFFVQFGVQGTFGVIPIFLSEISPPAFRATFTGLVYQLGNMASSASAQIEATGGDHLKIATTKPDGTIQLVPDYATVQGILTGVAAAWSLVFIIIGRENHSSHFERHKPAYQEGAAREEALIDYPSSGPLSLDIDEKSGEK